MKHEERKLKIIDISNGSTVNVCRFWNFLQFSIVIEIVRNIFNHWKRKLNIVGNINDFIYFKFLSIFERLPSKRNHNENDYREHC